MKSKVLSTCTLLLASILVVTACGNNNSNDSSASPSASLSASPSASSPASASGEKVELKMMHLWPQGTAGTQYKMVDDIIKQYEDANPNVTISTEILDVEPYKDKLKVLSASNSLPDIGFTWAAGFMDPYVNGNMFAPLDDLLQGGPLQDKFVAGTTDAFSFSGKTYGLPVELNIVPVYYNKEIFAKYNLQPPQTLDDLKNIIKTLNDNKVVPITVGGKDAWPASFWYMYMADRFGGPDVMDKGVASKDFSDPSLLAAAKELQGLVDMNAFEKGFNGLSNDEAKALFNNEQAAMYAMGTWEVPNYTTNPKVAQAFKDKIGYFKFPTVAGGKGSADDWVGGPGVGLFVSQNSKHVEEAKKFVAFFVEKWGERSVTEAGVIPATKVDTSAIQLPPMFIDLLNELSKASKVTLYLDTQMKPAAADVHKNMVQALFGKAVTPEEFIKKQDDALKAGK